jgi:HSP20 family protein
MELGDAVTQIQRDIESVFDDFGRMGLRRFGIGGAQPRLDVTESGDELVVEAELPGVDPSDVDVDLEGDVLTIKGEKKVDRDDQSKGYHIVERGQGEFERKVALPFKPDPEGIKASFDNGVLRITMPKPEEAKVEKKKIQVQST